MPTAKSNPRSEHTQQQKLRVQASPSLAEKFPTLKSLTVDLGFYDPAGLVRSSQIKYTVNPEHAKSVFCFACHNYECIRGDFDLSEVLAAAIGTKKKTVTGEVCCQGWRSRATIDSEPCHNLLRYKLTLAYH